MSSCNLLNNSSRWSLVVSLGLLRLWSMQRRTARLRQVLGSGIRQLMAYTIDAISNTFAKMGVKEKGFGSRVVAAKPTTHQPRAHGHSSTAPLPPTMSARDDDTPVEPVGCGKYV